MSVIVRRAAYVILVGFLGCAAPVVTQREHKQRLSVSKKRPISLVWVVSPQRLPETVTAFLEEALRYSPRFYAVIALPADFLGLLSEKQKLELLDRQAQGRIEIAILPASALPLSLFDDFALRLHRGLGLPLSQTWGAPHRVLEAFDVQRIIVQTEEAWRHHFAGQPLPGVVAPMGILGRRLLESLAAGRFPWVMAAAGGSSGLRAQHPLRIYRAGRFKEDELPSESFSSATEMEGIYVIDELYNKTPEQALESLKELLRVSESRLAQWEFVDLAYWPLPETAAPGAPLPVGQGPLERQRRVGPEAAGAGNIVHWGNDSSARFLWGSIAQRNFWRLMAQAHEDIARYQNSGTASLASLDRLWTAFFSLFNYGTAAALNEEQMLTAPGDAVEQRCRQTLRDIYKRMAPYIARPPLAALRQSLWMEWGAVETGSSLAGPGSGLGANDGAVAADATAGLGAGSDHFMALADLYDREGQGGASAELAGAIQASGSALRRSASGAPGAEVSGLGPVLQVPQPQAAAAALDLEALEIAWSEKEYLFNVNFASAVYEIPNIEIYIDLNHRPYVGYGQSYNGALRAKPEDFWEYLIRAGSDRQVFVYRYQSRRPPQEINRAPALVHVKNRAISFRIPREWLGGRDPSRWGWGLYLWRADDNTIIDCLESGRTEGDTLSFLQAP